MEKILEETLEKNIDLNNSNLVIQKFGNLSIKIDDDLFAIKPSGVDLKKIKSNDISIVNFDGEHLSGLKPSVDAPTHIYLYKNFKSIGSIVHTHSLYASSWAQSLMSIPPYGTTHADYVNGDLLCTRKLTHNEVESNYEYNTGVVIKETLDDKNISPTNLPGILVGSHGVFSWGRDSGESLDNAEIIEYIAKLAYLTNNINQKSIPIDNYLNSFHFNRKHGSDGYYGQ